MDQAKDQINEDDRARHRTTGDDALRIEPRVDSKVFVTDLTQTAGQFSFQPESQPLCLRTAALMNEKLPKYIQNLFLACEYDRMAKMKMPDDIDSMLKYVQENFSNDKRQIIASYI